MDPIIPCVFTFNVMYVVDVMNKGVHINDHYRVGHLKKCVENITLHIKLMIEDVARVVPLPLSSANVGPVSHGSYSR